MKLADAIPRPLEKSVQKGIVTLFRGCGGVVYETPQGFKITTRSHHRTPGMSDLIVFFPRLGRTLFFEVKRPGGMRTDAQLSFGGVVIVSGSQYCCGGVEQAKALMAEWGLLR